MPFEIPASWEWARLASIGEIVGGGTPKTGDSSLWSDSVNGIPWLTPADMKFVKGIYVAGGERYISQKGLSSSSAQLMPKNAILMSSRAPIGYIAIAKSEISTNQGFKSVVPQDGSMSLWVYWSIQGRIEDIKHRASGTTFKEISGSEFGETLIPVPPLAEQRRIVAKLNDVLPLVDEYRVLEAERETLDVELPDRLRKSVLELAVEGKLVTQDPSDEPAPMLLERIREERAKLVAEGKAKASKGGESVIYVGSDGRHYEKRGKGEPKDIEDEIPFDIPESWEWTRLGRIAMLNGGFAFKSENYSSTGTRVIRISDFNENGLIDSKIVRYQYSPQLEPYLLKSKDILICMTGGTVGKSLLLDYLPEQLLVNQRVAVVRAYSNPDYLNLVIKSDLFQSMVNENKNSTNDNISMADITKFLVPLPPLAEQARIIERVNEVLSSL